MPENSPGGEFSGTPHDGTTTHRMGATQLQTSADGHDATTQDRKWARTGVDGCNANVRDPTTNERKLGTTTDERHPDNHLRMTYADVMDIRR